jgi:hypothetical protein
MYDDTRSAWGARRPAYKIRLVSPSSRKGRTWHWAGPRVGLFGRPHSSCLAQVKAWQTYHINKGWGDIGYNALICVHARAIEGRGLRYQGAHSPGHNTSHWGIQFMVGEGEDVTVEMFERGAELAYALEEAAGHDLTDEGHSDNTATSCPGKQIYEWVHAGGPEEYDMPLSDADKKWIAQAIRENSYTGVWRTDDKMDATTPTEDNPKWWPERVLEDIAKRLRRIEEKG